MLKILLIMLLLPISLFAQTWQAESGDRQMAVLELFTSEGCGLCPAADRWVNKLPEQGITDDQLIVLAFHIDYLNDKKGWVDRFASPVFSDRQRQQAQLNLFQTIYTPEFVVSGEVIHNWQKHVKEVIHVVNGFAPESSITLVVSDNDGELIIDSHIAVEGEENRKYSQLYLAITEDDLLSEIKGGDNVGATFNHQHLVRKWLGPFSLNEGGETDFSTSVMMGDEWDINKTRVVAVVHNLEDGFVLQGLALPLSEHSDH
ncbi:MAG: DUF1223 domain-containing protein [Piscirickettsiaceae bacterium]|nr:DUF1223 domain-containing protein [Piscirickettsiaceae bacterium]